MGLTKGTIINFFKKYFYIGPEDIPKQKTHEIEKQTSFLPPISYFRTKRKSFNFGSSEQKFKQRQSHLIDVFVKATAKNKINTETLGKNRIIKSWFQRYKDQRITRNFSNLRENQLKLLGDKSFVKASKQREVVYFI